MQKERYSLVFFDNDTPQIAGFEIHEDLQQGKCTGSVQVKTIYVDNINQNVHTQKL